MHLWSSVSVWINNWRSDERGIGPYHDMDTISMLLTGWVIFIFVSVALVKYLYFRFVKKAPFPELDNDPDEEEEEGEEEEAVRSTSTRIVETITGVKSLASNKPQAPQRRKRVDKGAHQQESFDEVLAPNSSGPCTGPDPIVVDFINQAYDWAFKHSGTQRRSWEDFKETFISAVNKTLRNEDSKNEFNISIMNFTLKDDMKLNNLFAECTHPNNVKVTSDCEIQLIGQATASPKDGEIKRCKFFVDKISGRLSTLFDCEEKTAIAKLDGWPEICVGISLPSNASVDQKLTEAIGDRIASAIRNSVAEIDYSKVEGFPTAAKFSAIPKKKDGQQRYLLVKVIRAREVQKGCQEPYCCVELDDPPQKFQTDSVRSQDPVWNENFVLSVLPSGGELLFELYDKVGPKFLGCNIISVDDVKSENIQQLPLKSRRMETSEQYTGSVDVLFTMLSEAEFLLRSKDGKVSTNRNQITTTRSVFSRSPDSKFSTFAENVIKELEKKIVPNANKSTLIIHAVQRDPLISSPSSKPVVKHIKRFSDGSYNEMIQELAPIQEQIQLDDSGTGMDAQYGDERGRRKTRKGDIFTSIRRRFSKGRSQSVTSGGGATETVEVVNGEKTESLPRSVSADRQSMASARLGLGGSARSSTSELSGISGFSTSTFVHENSTLVIECVENRIQKYYLVPPNLAESGKYKKKGKKLHIYNDHTFLAKHLPGGTMCEICALRLPYSIGKQGYQCRDCKMTCHKECHIRAPSFCAKTTIYDIELSTAKPLESKCLFTSLFGGKDGGATNKQTDPVKNDEKSQKKGKKKTSIFRKVTRLGKISEENMTSKDDVVVIVEEDKIEEIKDQKTNQNKQIEDQTTASSTVVDLQSVTNENTTPPNTTDKDGTSV